MRASGRLMPAAAAKSAVPKGSVRSGGLIASGNIANRSSTVRNIARPVTSDNSRSSTMYPRLTRRFFSAGNRYSSCSVISTSSSSRGWGKTPTKWTRSSKRFHSVCFLGLFRVETTGPSGTSRLSNCFRSASGLTTNTSCERSRRRILSRIAPSEPYWISISRSSSTASIRNPSTVTS